MLISDAIHKADRLEQTKVLFGWRTEGVGTGEIARLLGVSQRTARHYVKELSERGGFRCTGGAASVGWWKAGIDLVRIQLNLDETWMLSAYSDKHNPHVVASLLKLAATLPDAIGGHVEQVAVVCFPEAACPGLSESSGRPYPGMGGRRQVQLVYRDPITGERSERLFDPKGKGFPQ